MNTTPPPHSQDARRIRVELWTDLICPWCGIGERRFAEALSKFEQRGRVNLSLRSFRLMPGAAPMPVEELLAVKYELTSEEIRASLRKLEDTAASVGLSYGLSGSFSGDTMDGHRLIKLAGTTGLEWRLHSRLFRAAMSERVFIYDHAVLLDLAVSCGLDPEAVRATLSGDQYREEVEADEAVMRGHGGHSVPFFVLNGQRHYTGALSADIFLDALNKAWTAVEQDDLPPPDGAVCGPDGCPLP